MKRIILALLTFIAVCGFQTVTAQARPEPVYWVVETNAKVPGSGSLVRFYDSGNTLIDERKFSRRIDVVRKRNRRTLNRLAETIRYREVPVARRQAVAGVQVAGLYKR
jgi:hypothetical protein